MSDVFAMGGTPVTALNILAYPEHELAPQVLIAILRGGAERAAAAGAVVVGGHTVVDPELKYGMAVTGVVHPSRFVRNSGAKRGDVLVLTKALGTGIVATGIKRRATEAAEERAAIASMVALNDAAGELLRSHGANACTDVTGYGLAGHAAEVASATGGVRLEFEATALSLLPGTARLAEAGLTTGGSKRNRRYLGRRLALGRDVSAALAEAVVDPQTSGGLLVSLSASGASGYVEELHDRGVRAAIVGRVTARPRGSTTLVAVV
jgi:selenide,water dikinase